MDHEEVRAGYRLDEDHHEAHAHTEDGRREQPPDRVANRRHQCQEAEGGKDAAHTPGDRRAVAVQVTRALKGRGFPRVDVILSADGVPYVLEMNTIPGMTPTSLLPMAAKQAGMEFDELVLAILKTAQLDHPPN